MRTHSHSHPYLLPYSLSSHKRIIKSPPPYSHCQAYCQQQHPNSNCHEVPFRKRPLHVPGPLLILSEPAQLHGIGNGIDPVQAGEDQRQKNIHRVFQPGKKVLIFSKLYAPGLLGLADAVVVTLDVRNVTKGDCHRITHFVGNPNAVQTGRKLTWVCGRNKQNRNRQRHKIFQRNIQHIKQLFRSQVIPPEQMTQHMSGTIQGSSLIWIKQENKQVVQQQKHQHKDHHKPHFAEFDLAQLKRRQAHCKQPKQHPGIIGDHTCKGEKQKKSQLGSSCQFVDHTFPWQIIQYRLSGHDFSPPCPPQ